MKKSVYSLSLLGLLFAQTALANSIHYTCISKSLGFNDFQLDQLEFILTDGPDGAGTVLVKNSVVASAQPTNDFVKLIPLLENNTEFTPVVYGNMITGGDDIIANHVWSTRPAQLKP
jgi:hypothetical protein